MRLEVGSFLAQLLPGYILLEVGSFLAQLPHCIRLEVESYIAR